MHVVYLKQCTICNLLVNMFKPLKIAPRAAFSPFHDIVLFHLDVRTVPSKSIYPTGAFFFPPQKKKKAVKKMLQNFNQDFPRYSLKMKKMLEEHDYSLQVRGTRPPGR